MWYDLLTLCILMFATYRGAMKGIVWQLATIASLLLCFFFSGSLSMSLAPFIRVEPPLNRWIAMLILYVAFSFVSFGAARMLHEMIEQIKFDAFDHHLGAVLGLLKGGVFSICITFFLVTLSGPAREAIMYSESGYVEAVVIDRLSPVIPGNLHALLEPYIRRLDELEYRRRHGELTHPDELDDLDDRFVDDRRSRDRFRDRDDRQPFDDGRELGDRNDVRDPRDRRKIEDRRDLVDGRDPRPLDRDRIDRPEQPLADDPFGESSTPRVDRRRERFRYDDRNGSRPPLPDDRVSDPVRDESDWLSSLPETLGEELKQLARKVWRSTRSEDRSELRRRVVGAGPDSIRKMLREWENGRPGASGPADGERAALVREIANALADRDADRRAARDDIEGSFAGLPEEVVLAVLRDWRADLRDPDHDPRTTGQRSLSERILRQLKRSGISLRSLDEATQDRLRRSQLR